MYFSPFGMAQLITTWRGRELRVTDGRDSATVTWKRGREQMRGEETTVEEGRVEEMRGDERRRRRENV